MPDTEKIKFYMGLFKDIGPGDLYSLISATKMRTLAPGEIYIREGETCEKLAYIRHGLIRCYSVNERGDEITLLLRWEDQFIASHDGIFFQKASRFAYQALEQTSLLEVNYGVLQQILDKNPAFERQRYYFILSMLSQTMARVESFVLLNPEERYLQLVTDKPDIIQRVPDKHLATLLGITPVSLSRIRKRIAQKHTR